MTQKVDFANKIWQDASRKAKNGLPIIIKEVSDMPPNVCDSDLMWTYSVGKPLFEQLSRLHYESEPRLEIMFIPDPNSEKQKSR
jgi:hypothetical protein